MKFLIAFGLLFSQWATADFVYMREDNLGKSVLLQTTEAHNRTINDLAPGLIALYPDISPDGQEVVYSEGSAPDDLYLAYKNLNSNISKRFHHSQKGMVLHSKFSKNGKWIFYSAPGPSGKNTVYYFDREEEMKKQGRSQMDYSLAEAKALDPSEESYFPRPSSDGNFVVYQRNISGKKEIVFFNRLENTKKVLALGMSPALSFDEKLIAFTSKVNGNWDINIIDRTTGAIKQLTSDSADEMAPTFLPDNSIVFASNKSGSFMLYKLGETGWEKLNLAGEGKDVDFYSPQFSGDVLIKQSVKANFIGQARSSFGTVSHNGKLYMAGGHQGHEHTYPPESFSDSFIVYDSVTNAWTELAPRPAKAHGFQLAANGNYIYAFGGFAYSEVHKPKWKSLTQIDRYNIKENKWETIGHLLNPRSSNVAITISGKVYLAGGWDSTPKFENDLDGTFHDTIEVFDLTSEKIFLASFKIPLPLRRALTGVEWNGKLLLIGGLGQGASHFNLISHVTAVDVSDGSSSELNPLPFATFAPAAEILNNKLFVFGGMFKMGEDYEYVSHIYHLDLASEKWFHTGRCLKETKGFSQAFKLDDQTLGILGGHHYFEGDDAPVSTFETMSY